MSERRRNKGKGPLQDEEPPFPEESGETGQSSSVQQISSAMTGSNETSSSPDKSRVQTSPLQVAPEPNREPNTNVAPPPDASSAPQPAVTHTQISRLERQIMRLEQELERRDLERRNTRATSATPRLQDPVSRERQASGRASTVPRGEPFATLLANTQTRHHESLESETDSETDKVHYGKDVKINAPPEFDGKQSDLPVFLNRLRRYIVMQPKAYNTGPQRVICAGSYLIGRAATWYEAISSSSPPPNYLNNLDSFCDELQHIFGRIDPTREARRKLETLRQTSSASAYYTSFLALAAQARIGPVAEAMLFRKGLKEELKDSLATLVDEPTNLQDLAELVIRLAERMHERTQERKGNRGEGNQSSGQTTSSANNESLRQRKGNRNRRNLDSTSGNRGTTDGKRDNNNNSNQGLGLTRGPLSDAEKKERYNKGLCLICASPEHLRDKCPFKRPNQGGQSAQGNKRRTNINATTTQQVDSNFDSTQSKNGKAPTL